VTTIDEAYASILRSTEAPGAVDRDLAIGLWTVRFVGFDSALAASLEARWGGYLGPAGVTPATAVVHVRRPGGPAFLPPPRPGESYRIEAGRSGETVVARSYGFAIAPAGTDAYTIAAAETPVEPMERTLDNAARWVVARLAASSGGIALHGAAVLRGGTAHVFTGPSRAGKSTAARLSPGSTPLGDDFAVVVPEGAGWGVAGVPFDNAESAPAAPPRGLYPLAGIWRLFQDSVHRVDRPGPAVAQASLLACCAFPWALPDLLPDTQRAVEALVGDGRFGHLHFAPDPGFWPLLEGEG
jgi:hypothetical protein